MVHFLDVFHALWRSDGDFARHGVLPGRATGSLYVSATKVNRNGPGHGKELEHGWPKQLRCVCANACQRVQPKVGVFNKPGVIMAMRIGLTTFGLKSVFWAVVKSVAGENKISIERMFSPVKDQDCFQRPTSKSRKQKENIRVYVSLRRSLCGHSVLL